MSVGVDDVRCGVMGWCDMPMRARRACCVPGCGALVDDGQYCDVHRRVSSDGDERVSASRRGYDYRWRQLRRMVLSAHPLCADPFNVHAADGVVVLATDVHHVVPLSSGAASQVLNRMDNLQPLCHSCHSRVTAAETKMVTAGGGGR